MKKQGQSAAVGRSSRQWQSAVGERQCEDIPWRVRMERLTERLAKSCIGCPYAGSRCAVCDCGTAAGIIRDRNAEGTRLTPPEKTVNLRVISQSRRMQVAGNMTGRGWLKPADILWPCEVKPNTRTMDLEALVSAGIVERSQPDPANARVFLYRRVEK